MEKIIMPQNQGNSSGTSAPNKALRVLIADDSEDDVVILLHVLRRAGYEPVYERVSTAPAMKSALEQPWDIVISDFEMPHFGGFEALQLLRDSGRDLPFILVSAVVSEEMAVTAMKAGAHDYIMKRNLIRLPPAIERELQEFQTRAARKAAVEALRRSEEQLRQSQKIEAVGRLAAGVAHDFNNFLTAITGHSELLLRQLGVGDPLRKHAEQIEKVAYLAAVLTRQLMSFSRKQVIEPRVLELNAVISNVEKMLCQLIGDDIEFCASLDPAAGHIKADAGQIEQVVMNLAVNARDAMPNGGKLAITTASVTVDKNHLKNFPGLCAGDYVVITIADTGTGMSEEVKAHLFEPFFTTKPLGKGTGLGLATCFGIVKQNNGHINVQSELGKGATFKIYFPQLPLTLESSPVPIRPPAAAGGDETVLLVEDEPAVREFAVATLREKGYAVVEAVNGEEGIRLARQHDGKIDLVLTDVVMPIMGGKEMADALRASHPGIKFLFTSGYTDDALMQHGVLRPDVKFLQKPYMTATLTRKVREVLDEDPTGVAVSITTCP
jgi:signal transduction histidine kinase